MPSHSNRAGLAHMTTNVIDMQWKRSLLDYFGASLSKRKQSDESSTTSGNVQSSTASSEYVSHASCSSTAHTSTNIDTVASESSIEFSQCTNTDIAAGPHQPPVQPIVNFPSRTFGSKKRSFNCEWYKLYTMSFLYNEWIWKV